MSTEPHGAPAVRHGDGTGGVAGSPGGTNAAEGDCVALAEQMLPAVVEMLPYDGSVTQT